MKKRNQHESLSITGTIDSQQITLLKGVLGFSSYTLNNNMKIDTKLDTPKSPLAAVDCTTHNVELVFNMNLTMMFWPHPDIHDEILKEAGADKNDAVQVESALRDYANETVEGSAFGLIAWANVADGTGFLTYYANERITPNREQNNPMSTHYATPVVGGDAADPKVARAREFFNSGFPDARLGLVTGKKGYHGNGKAVVFSYAKASADGKAKMRKGNSKTKKK